jgi:hypothetical protein
MACRTCEQCSGGHQRPFGPSTRLPGQPVEKKAGEEEKRQDAETEGTGIGVAHRHKGAPENLGQRQRSGQRKDMEAVPGAQLSCRPGVHPVVVAEERWTEVEGNHQGDPGQEKRHNAGREPMLFEPDREESEPGGPGRETLRPDQAVSYGHREITPPGVDLGAYERCPVGLA